MKGKVPSLKEIKFKKQFPAGLSNEYPVKSVTTTFFTRSVWDAPFGNRKRIFYYLLNLFRKQHGNFLNMENGTQLSWSELRSLDDNNSLKNHSSCKSFFVNCPSWHLRICFRKTCRVLQFS